MGFLYRDDYSGGWRPSDDLVRGSKAGFLRADNVVQDEIGLWSLRLPASVISQDPMRSNTSSVHSLFTTTLNGTRYRCAGVDEFGYRNFGSFGTFDGSGDLIFGAHQGMILASRGGTVKWKTDGTNTRSWGIAGPSSAPTVQVLAPREIDLMTEAPTEATLWANTEPNGAVDTAQGVSGAAQVAVYVLPDKNTGKGTAQKVIAGGINLNSFDSGAAAGANEDAIEFWAYLSNPSALEYVSLAFDCNPASTAPFQDDYYTFELTAGESIDVKLDNKQVLEGHAGDAEGSKRDKFIDDRDPDSHTVTKIRRDTPSGNAGWSKFRVLRGQMERVGSTPGCDWSTVQAVQFAFKYSIPSSGGVVGIARIDGLKVLGGADRTLTGKFKARFVWARVFTDYTALSAPSPETAEFEVRNGAVLVTPTQADSSAADSQVHEPGGQAWAYLGGGTMQSYYRAGVTTAQGVSTPTVSCTDSERTMILTDLTLETDNLPPPDGIVDIIGPHFNRMLVLTAKVLWIARDGNPDSYSQAQALDVGDAGETALWGIKAQSNVFIGTTKDIYRLSGTLSEFPDGTMDARLEPMSIPGPPISAFKAQEGSSVVYLAADGFRSMEGSTSVSINWNLDLLVQGYTRHGVSPLNLGPVVGKVRGGISNSRLYCLVEEGSAVLASNAVYVADLRRKSWRRETYNRSFQSLYREPDGTVIAGDSSGYVWQLADAASVGLGDKRPTSEGIPTAIPVTIWTVSDDDGKPTQYKESYDWRAELDTGGVSATVALYLDEVAGPSLTTSRNGYGTVQQTLGSNTAIARCRRIQSRITGSFFTFKLGSWGVTYRECPTPLLFWDSGFLDFGGRSQDLEWFREMRFKVRSPVSLSVRVYFDGVLNYTGTCSVTANVESIYPLVLGREVKGRLPRVIIEPSTGKTDPANAFELYWMGVFRRDSGTVTEKKFMVSPGRF